MKNAKHTPGPWEVSGRYNVSATFGVQYNASNHSATAEQLSANARLIAAAPEMLKALELVLNDNRLMNAMSREQSRAILDAITKATGGAE